MVEKLEKPISISDVGVLLLGFNRPELLKKRINEIYESEIENLYVSIDGGSKSHTDEMELLKSYIQIKFSNLVNLSLKHHKENLGLVKHITGEIDYVFTKYQYIIVIEDDIKISINFINNMINGLNMHKNNNSNGVVSGFSPLHFKYSNNYYRRSRYPYMWGWACSKSSWQGYTYDLSEVDIEQKLSNSVSWNRLKPSQKMKWLRLFRKAQVNPLETWDSQLVFLSYCRNFINLAPVFSIVGNEGFNDSRAVHTKDKKSRFVTVLNLNNAAITKKSKYLNSVSNFFDKFFMNDF